MARLSLTTQAQQLILDRVSSGDAVIDATLGNGHDALFLAQCIGRLGVLFGFDIQPQALANTQQSLAMLTQPPEICLMRVSHAEMLERIPVAFRGRIQAIMFNLGYLPGADKLCITQADSTLIALNAAIELLAPGGIVTVMVYPGHPGGEREAEAVRHWLEALDESRYCVECIASHSDKSSAPRLFVIDKRVDLL